MKRFGPAVAVAGIDLEIADGEFVVLLGPSGCGKTTTLRCIAGLEGLAEGEIRIGDQVVSRPGYALPPERREMGMVFQSYAIWPHLSVAENVAFGLKLKKLPAAEIRDRVARALDLVGLGRYGDRGASQLSGGQQQRVALARAVVLEPGVLLFDEPLSNLDAKLREKMRFELRQLQQRLGITSIYVTHDQQEAMVIADRVVLMNGGRIEQMGGPIELYQRPKSLFAAEFIGLANILPGTVASSSDGGTTVSAGALALHSADTGFRAGQRVTAICRPENLRVSIDRPEGPNAWQARLDLSYFLGNIADVYLSVGDVQLRGQLSPPETWAPGKSLWVQMPPDKVILLPDEAMPAQ
ncbi:ABC transporter ATP-binding protein [Allostella vacuolata]|nr:ABC transporter ATP-binding protein [Stella vacuolata]